MQQTGSKIIHHILEKSYGMENVVSGLLKDGFYCEGNIKASINQRSASLSQPDFGKICNDFKEILTSKSKNVYLIGNILHIDDRTYTFDDTLDTKIDKVIITNVSNNNGLCRVHCIAFKNKNEYKAYILKQEELEKRDHRVLGQRLDLFFFSEQSPGSCFFLPHGMRIYNKLLEYIKKEYFKRGFDEVSTPSIYNKELWEISGHWDKYAENMFSFNIKDETTFSLKPMNCPGHCLLFKHLPKSYKDLPVRYADFSALHRNECKGALTGLTRVRKFTQDDAHIFCRKDQIAEEMQNCLQFLEDVYKVFGFEFTLNLSTRPKEYIGTIELWDYAEEQLKHILDTTNRDYKINPEDGAFYGPKIDIMIKDNIQRLHQCATIQLDFNLPERFALDYVDDANIQTRPIIIHRAIYGSFERFIALLLEHYAGKLPFWISPRQILVCPITLADPEIVDYCKKVNNIFKSNYYYSDIDLTTVTFNKKIRNAQQLFYNYIIVIGKKEATDNEINVRYQDATTKIYKIDDFITELKDQSPHDMEYR